MFISVVRITISWIEKTDVGAIWDNRTLVTISQTEQTDTGNQLGNWNRILIVCWSSKLVKRGSSSSIICLNSFLVFDESQMKISSLSTVNSQKFWEMRCVECKHLLVKNCTLWFLFEVHTVSFNPILSCKEGFADGFIGFIGLESWNSSLIDFSWRKPSNRKWWWNYVHVRVYL